MISQEPSRLQRAFTLRPKIVLIILLITTIWLLLIVAIDPRGDFPLNDDWSYGWSVQQSIQSGGLVLADWTSMPLLTHIMWGAGFSEIFGFSFTTLRISTLILGGIGLLFTVLLLSEVTKSHIMLVIGVLTIALNPIFLSLSFTFMTDVPFVAFSVAASYCFIRSLKNHQLSYLLFALMFSLVATLNRQIGLVLPASFAIAGIYRYGFKKEGLVRALAPFIFVAFMLVLYERFLTINDMVPQLYSVSYERLYSTFSFGLQQAFRFMMHRSLTVLLYVGLFALPLLIAVLPANYDILSRRQSITATLLSVSFTSTVFLMLRLSGNLMPMSGNILFDLGIGPATLHDAYELQLGHLPKASPMLWTLVTLLSLVGACGLLVVSSRVLMHIRVSNRRTYRASVLIYLFLVLSLYAGLLSFTGLFDRYIIFLLPFVVALIVSLTSERPPKITKHQVLAYTLSISFLLAGGMFGVAATHDYLSWNRVRWQVLESLVGEAEIHPQEINGGFEFNKWYQQNAPLDTNRNGPLELRQNDCKTYVLTFGSVSGYRVDSIHHYARWLPPSSGTLFLLSPMRPCVQGLD